MKNLIVILLGGISGEREISFLTGKAKSKDLEKLIYQVQNKVLEKTGINLELELQIIGENL